MKQYYKILLIIGLAFGYWGCQQEKQSPITSFRPERLPQSTRAPIERSQPDPNVPAMIEISREDLLKQKKEQLISEITGLEKLKKQTFEAALRHYEALLNKPENKLLHGEKVRIIRDDAKNNEAVSDIIVKKLYPVKVETTADWMHYHDGDIANKWAAKNTVVSYLDYANASLGGGAFGHGWVQEEQMVAFCTELALLLAAVPPKAQEHALQDKSNINFVTRSTRNASLLSPRPKYLVNIRCATGTPKGVKAWNDINILEHNDNPPATNIIAAATVNIVGTKAAYQLLDLVDLFSNIYRAFELVKNTNDGKQNVIFGGRLGAGVFGQSVLMSAAMQILSAKILGIENLILTGQEGGAGSGKIANIYQEALDKVESFVASKNIIGMKVEDILRDFLAYVGSDNKWEKNSSYK